MVEKLFSGIVCKIRKMISYTSEHIISRFIFVLITAVLLLEVILQTYLRNHYLNYIEDNSLENEQAILKTVKDNINNSLQGIVSFGSELAVSTSLYDVIKEADNQNTMRGTKLYNTLSGYDYKNDEVSVAIVGQDGLIGQYDKYRSSTQGLMWNASNINYLVNMYDEIMAKCRNSEYKSFPRYMLYTAPGNHLNDSFRVFHIAYPILGAHNGLKNMEYIMVITYKMNMMQDYVKSVEIPKVDYIEGFISDSNGVVVYDENNKYSGMNINTDISTNCKVSTEKLDYFGWSLNALIDETKLQAQVNNVFKKSMMVLSVLISIYAGIIIMLVRYILEPVKRISNALSIIKAGDNSYKIKIEGKHEIWQLAEEYNKMVDSLNEKEKEIERQHETAIGSLKNQYDAEKTALESQINSHFICNTIGVINYEAIDAGNEKVSLLLKKLSNILRYTFDQKCQEVFIGQEVAWIEQYLYLQKERFENLFDYTIDYDDRYSDWPSCKLMLEPFVENSILHGFDEIECGGMIDICIMEQCEKLYIRISDNGKGIDQNTAERINTILTQNNIDLHMGNNLGIGITNVIIRMRRFYGEKMTAIMKTEKGKGTVFEFYLPIPESSFTENK